MHKQQHGSVSACDPSQFRVHSSPFSSNFLVCKMSVSCLVAKSASQAAIASISPVTSLIETFNGASHCVEESGVLVSDWHLQCVLGH